MSRTSAKSAGGCGLTITGVRDPASSPRRHWPRPRDAGLEHDPAAQGRVVAALAARAIRVQFRRAQFLIPAFLLPLVLLAVIASGTSAARNLPAFPDTGAYVGFVVGGTLMQGALLAGLTAASRSRPTSRADSSIAC